jgi:hypothetical protein
MRLSKPAWRVIAVIVAVTLFWMATRVEVYHATSPRDVSRALFGPDVFQFAHPPWLSLHVWLRKAYSILAFALVGYTAERALDPTSRPAVRAAVLVASYSFAIEVAQRVFVGPEPAFESVFDVACGSLGGWLAIVADRRMGLWAVHRRPALYASRER